MVLACLEAENVDVVFGFPGGAVLTLYDEIYKKDLRHILSRHEQGAVHAAGLLESRGLFSPPRAPGQPTL